MGTFRKTIKHSRSSQNLDDKIKSLDEDLVKTGVLPREGEKNLSDKFFNWRQEFAEPLNLKEEVDIVIEEVKEKNRYLSSIENTIKESKINEANKLFNEVYGQQVYDVVEKYISKYDGEIQNLREDIILELEKKPRNLKFLEKRLDKLDEKYNSLSRKISKNLVENTKITEQSSVTFEQLKDHYQSLIGKLQKQLSMSGSGGGEVNLKYLDDIVGIATNPSIYDGKYLKYEHSIQKFVFSDVVGGSGGGGIELSDLFVINATPINSESTLDYDSNTGIFTFSPQSMVGFLSSNNIIAGTGINITETGSDITISATGSGSGVGYDDLSVSVNSPGISTLSYDGTGVFEYTPPDLSAYVTSDNLSGFSTTGDLSEFISYTDLFVSVNSPGISTLSYDNSNGTFTYTPPDLSGVATTGYVDNAVVGVATTGYVDNAVVGFVTGYVDNAVVGFVTTGYVDNAVVGFVTSGYVDNAVVGFATTGYVDNAVVGLVTTGDLTYSDAIIPFAIAKFSEVSGQVQPTTSIGMTASAHQFSALNFSYIDFTFDNAQPDSDYIVLDDYEVAESNLSIELTNITTTGFRANFYNESTGDPTSGGSILTYKPIFIVYGSNPRASVPVTLNEGIEIQGSSSSVGIASIINFDGSLSVSANISGIVTVSAPSAEIVGIDTSGTSTFTNVNVSGISTFGSNTLFNGGMQEAFDTLINSTGTVSHDCSTGHIFYHTTPSADWTVNLTNLSLTAEYGATISIVVNQGGTAFMPTALQIGGVAQAIKWQGNSNPSGTASGIDVVSFSILNDGGTYVVMGQSVSFGGV